MDVLDRFLADEFHYRGQEYIYYDDVIVFCFCLKKECGGVSLT